jgi:predicted ATPase
MDIKEKLTIKNFFSIKDFEWDIKGFNVLTGGMGSGKSLALKLLYFCEQIFHLTIFSEPKINKELFDKDVFFRKIEEKFNNIFASRDREIDFINTQISYCFCNLLSEQTLFNQEDNNFDLSAAWDKKLKRFTWSSKYVTSKLEKWQALFDAPKTPELLDNVRNNVYSSISSDFANYFPPAAMFIPASRAITAIADTVTSRDTFIMDFFMFKNFALSFDDISNNIVNTILQVKEIKLNEKKDPVFELIDGRKISALELSSGQQELLYLLLLVNDLQGTRFKFGESVSVFIEEPSAHLFPKEQKEVIEFLVKYFNLLQNKKRNIPGHRFFISTHSPYILNAINNILEKKRLLKQIDEIRDGKIKEEMMEKIKVLGFPDLSINDVSAYMIGEDKVVSSMVTGSKDDDDKYIYSEVINKIAHVISDDSNELLNLHDEITKYIFR